MAERPTWQAAIDPRLLAHLHRPLRRSAAVGCAWAREALARARLGGLPLFASWSARWGIRAADVTGLRPIVHASASEPTSERPRPVVARTVVISEVARPVATAIAAPRVEHGPAATSPRAGDERVSAEPAARRIDLAIDPETLLGRPSAPVAPTREAGPTSAPVRDATPLLAPMRDARSVDVHTSDVKLVSVHASDARPVQVHASDARPVHASDGTTIHTSDAKPVRVHASDATTVHASDATPVRVHASGATPGIVPMRDTPPEVVPPHDTRPASGPTSDASTSPASDTSAPRVPTITPNVHAGEGTPRVHASLPATSLPPLGRPRGRRADLVTTQDLARRQAGAAPEVPTSPAGPREPVLTRDPTPRGPVAVSPVIEAPRPVVPLAPQLHAPATIDLPTIAPAAPRIDVARPRVTARPLGGASPVLMDSSQRPAPARPRVPAQAPVLATPAMRAPTEPARPTGASRLDLALPAAVAAQVAAPSSPPIAAAPPVAPVVAPLRVSTAALDIPAIAQAVHRHLERELRWERERKGGRA